MLILLPGGKRDKMIRMKGGKITQVLRREGGKSGRGGDFQHFDLRWGRPDGRHHRRCGHGGPRRLGRRRQERSGGFGGRRGGHPTLDGAQGTADTAAAATVA